MLHNIFQEGKICLLIFDFYQLVFRNVIKSFYTSGLLLDVVSSFGELSEEVSSSQLVPIERTNYTHCCSWRRIASTPSGRLRIFTTVWRVARRRFRDRLEAMRRQSSQVSDILCLLNTRFYLLIYKFAEANQAGPSNLPSISEQSPAPAPAPVAAPRKSPASGNSSFHGKCEIFHVTNKSNAGICSA